MFNKMFGGFAQSLMGMVQQAMPEAPKMGRIGWHGLQPKKIIPSTTVARYPDGPTGDIHRRRAAKRLDRWIRSHGKDLQPPTHIFDNFQEAIRYQQAAT